jgi:hypothetical protein
MEGQEMHSSLHEFFFWETAHRRQLSSMGKCPIKCTDLFDIKFELFYVTMEIIPKNGNVPSGYFKCER